MADDLNAPRGAAEKLPELRPLPDDAIQRWVSIPHNSFIQIPLSRSDVDNLFFAINSLISAQNGMQNCMVEYSKNNFGNADSALNSSKIELVTAANFINDFMKAMMIKAEKL